MTWAGLLENVLLWLLFWWQIKSNKSPIFKNMQTGALPLSKEVKESRVVWARESRVVGRGKKSWLKVKMKL